MWTTMSNIINPGSSRISGDQQWSLLPRCLNSTPNCNFCIISREFRRDMSFFSNLMGKWTYKADYAHGYVNERRKKIPKYVKFTEDVKVFVIEKIQEDWSPEQISGYAKRHVLFSISHEIIYQFILQDKQPENRARRSGKFTDSNGALVAPYGFFRRCENSAT